MLPDVIPTRLLRAAALSLLTLPAFVSAHACADPDPALEVGYRQMYNLDFAAAHETFQSWQHTHPQDPLGFVSDGAAYLFAEFDRLHVLESELFTDDQKFKARQKLMPDPAVKTAFDNSLKKAEQLAAEAPSESSAQHTALFAQILANGLRGDYAAMVEKKNFASLGYMKSSRNIAEKLIATDPECYDAYLAIGVENYLLGSNPAPVRWILRITGAQTDKDEGLARLHLTAEKGHYLAPYARLLLAVAALRDKDHATARVLLAGLAKEFPDNSLYRRELARIPPS